MPYQQNPDRIYTDRWFDLPRTGALCSTCIMWLRGSVCKHTLHSSSLVSKSKKFLEVSRAECDPWLEHSVFPHCWKNELV
jgi:hypothetical protein